MPLSNYFTSLAEFFFKLPQKNIAKIISVTLIIYIAYLAANLTWLVVPQQNSKTLTGGKTSNFNNNFQQKVKQHIDINGLTKLNLFGRYQVHVVDEEIIAVKDAPETRLNLILTGVVTSSKKEKGAAIIENTGKQETYGIGEKIAGTRATLAQVMNDRVLIKQSGRLETLMLDGFEYKKVSSVQRKKSTGLRRITVNESNKDNLATTQIDLRKNKALAQRMKKLKDDLAQNPAKISDYLKISRVTNAGKTIGYRLTPSKDKAFFDAAGLKVGDIAIAMNGYDLTDTAQAAQALKALRESSEISLTVNRQGRNSEILFSINK